VLELVGISGVLVYRQVPLAIYITLLRKGTLGMLLQQPGTQLADLRRLAETDDQPRQKTIIGIFANQLDGSKESYHNLVRLCGFRQTGLGRCVRSEPAPWAWASLFWSLPARCKVQ
jgi:hypothetical protein